MFSLIAFLGNTGHAYERTRHNIAWQLEPYLSFSPQLSWQTKFKGRISQVALPGGRCVLLKPETLMNLSGNSVQSTATFFKIPAEEILVVHDDLELFFGTISCRQGGGLAGHNGLRSIADRLGTRNFGRFRLGISRPSRGNVADYVLSPFSAAERNDLDRFLSCAARHLEICLPSGPKNERDAAEKLSCL